MSKLTDQDLADWRAKRTGRPTAATEPQSEAAPPVFTAAQKDKLIEILNAVVADCTPVGAARKIESLQSQLAALPLAYRGGQPCLLCSHCGGHHTSAEHMLEFCGESGCDRALIFSCRTCQGLTRVDFVADENGDTRWAASKTDAASVGVELARIAQSEEQAAASRNASGRRCTVDGIVYPSIVEAARANGVPYSRAYNALAKFSGACVIAGKTYRLEP